MLPLPDRVGRGFSLLRGTCEIALGCHRLENERIQARIDHLFEPKAGSGEQLIFGNCVSNCPSLSSTALVFAVCLYDSLIVIVLRRGSCSP
jgi:hypothetical protein